jgi:aminoglycoside phosphotransferase (APT) family kinase protein
VFRLTRAPVVVRIAGSTAVRNRTNKVVNAARWLAEHDAPAVRLLPGIEQPIKAAGHVATLWQEVPAVGPKPTGADLGSILKVIHALPAPTVELPAWNPLGPMRERLDDPEGIEPEDLAFLRERCGAMAEELASVEYVLPSGPVHGDAFMGNLIPGPNGPVICDFDSASTGPREWDLTPVATGRLRFSYPGNTHNELAASYGFDVMSWDGFPVLRQLRELQLVTSVVPVLRSNPSLRSQWEHRLKTFRSGDVTAKWTPYR